MSYTLVSTLGAKVTSGTLTMLNAPSSLELDFTQHMDATGVYILQLTNKHAQAHLKLMRR